MSVPRYLLPTASLVAWATVVALGFAHFERYKATPGAPGIKPGTAGNSARIEFPTSTLLTPNPRGQTLVMFAHPHCPCTQASLSELAAILAECPNLQPAQIVFPLPKGAPASWQTGQIVRASQAMTGVRVIWDEEEQLTRALAAETSGQVYLFDAAGQPLFSGGITALRGHAGWNAGRGAIVAHHQRRPGARDRTPVYGCELLTHTRGDETP